MRAELLSLCVVLASSCGAGGPSGSGEGGGSGSMTTTFCCSINSRSYDCPDQAATDQCANIDNPDPSRCTRRSSACR